MTPGRLDEPRSRQQIQCNANHPQPSVEENPSVAHRHDTDPRPLVHQVDRILRSHDATREDIGAEPASMDHRLDEALSDELLQVAARLAGTGPSTEHISEPEQTTDQIA
jgi:hypothetical protein